MEGVGRGDSTAWLARVLEMNRANSRWRTNMWRLAGRKYDGSKYPWKR